MLDQRQYDPREREGGLRMAMWWLRGLAAVTWPFTRKDTGGLCPGNAALGSFLLVVAMAVWKDSLAAWVLLWLWLLAIIRMRAMIIRNQKKGIIFHRYWDGTPWLSQKLFPRVKSISNLKGWDAFLAASIGVALVQVDAPVGGLVIASAAASFIHEALMVQIRKNRVFAIRDAQSEMEQTMSDYYHGF
jgi:hypothetical protein